MEVARYSSMRWKPGIESGEGVTAVIPYFGYAARQDRRTRSARVPITAKVAAKMISGGRYRPYVLTVDLHADQIQGFFDMYLWTMYTLRQCCWRISGATTRRRI